MLPLSLPHEAAGEVRKTDPLRDVTIWAPQHDGGEAIPTDMG
jgi:hypothetical protein